MPKFKVPRENVELMHRHDQEIVDEFMFKSFVEAGNEACTIYPDPDDPFTVIYECENKPKDKPVIGLEWVEVSDGSF